MKCPSCEGTNVTTIWVRHHFKYGVDPGVMLSTSVPMRNCLDCGEDWLDHVGEGIIDKVIANHLSTEKP